MDKRYSALPETAKDFDSKYAAVLSSYDSPVRTYSRVEREIMRATNFQYKTPKEAWAAEGGGSQAGRKILCKRFSTKSRMALESRADSGLDPLITESHGGQSGMRAGTA